MRKMVCPQCKVGAFYVLNGQGERLPVYVSDKGEVVPKDPAGLLLMLFLARDSETSGEILIYTLFP